MLGTPRIGTRGRQAVVLALLAALIVVAPLTIVCTAEHPEGAPHVASESVLSACCAPAPTPPPNVALAPEARGGGGGGGDCHGCFDVPYGATQTALKPALTGTGRGLLDAAGGSAAAGAAATLAIVPAGRRTLDDPLLGRVAGPGAGRALRAAASTLTLPLRC